MNIIVQCIVVSIILAAKSLAYQSCANVDDLAVTKVTDVDEKDFVFAGLFPIKKRGCGLYHKEKGVERMEAMIRAIQLINENNELLTGVKIGYDLRDTCGQESVGIEEAISLVQSEFNSGNLSGIPIGVIGAASSSVTVPIASFLRVFKVPQISYSSTSALLSDTNRYDYFFRTVAPDNFQASAMLDIINSFGWRFVNALYTQSTYGTPGVEAFTRAVQEKNETCLDVESEIPSDATELNALAMRVAHSQANIVLCFCTATDANNILVAVRDYVEANMPNRTHIVWIASDSWATSDDAIRGVEQFADGFFGVAPFAKEYVSFTNYFTNINPYNITHDFWFCGYFRELLNCEYNTTNPGMKCPNSLSEVVPNFQQNNIIPFIFDATYALANALNSVLVEKCDFPYKISDQKCKEKNGNNFINVGGEILRDALYKVNFTGTTRDFVFFDESGDGQAKYSIYNYQYGKMNPFQEIGVWDSAKSENKLDIMNFSKSDNITSYCGGIPPCEPGFKTNFQVGSKKCCWTCQPCMGNMYSSERFALACKTCPSGEWGNNPLVNNTACELIPVMFISYNIWWNVLFLVISLLGFAGWTVISIIYFVNWKHKVVRCSGREHCVLMLIGAGISFVLPVFTIAKPLIVTCVIWTLLYWLSLSLLIFPLLMKIVRIVRIFITKQNVHTKRFLSWQWQIGFSLVPVVIVLCIVIISYSTRPNVIEVLKFTPSQIATPNLQLTCMSAHIAFTIVIYAIFILSVIILLFFAILTRTYPKNYRESVHIMYASFSLIVVMFANVTLFFVLTGEFIIYRRLVQNICLMLIAATILLAFFGPRLYYVLFNAKNIQDDDDYRVSTTDRKATDAEIRESDFKKYLAKNYPSILDPFAKYTNKYNAKNEETSLEKKEKEQSADGIVLQEVILYENVAVEQNGEDLGLKEDNSLEKN